MKLKNRLALSLYAEGGTERHSSDRDLAFIVLFNDGSHRIAAIDRKYQNKDTYELKLKELQKSISAIIGKPVSSVKQS